MIRASDVTVVTSGVQILKGVSLVVNPGELLALVGPNGAGKSTLLSVLSGDVAPTSGSVTLGDAPISGFTHIELARRRSVLTQENQVSFSFTVQQVVEMGRAPWARTELADDDDSAVASALAATDTAHLVGRHYTQLSGGEKARVSLARVLAQRADVVFLDEPTAALDLSHQEDVMHTAAALAAAGRTVVVVVHDLSLAAAYADRVAVIANGALDSTGTPSEVFTAERISRIYGLPVDVIERDGRPVVLPVRSGRS